MAPPRNTTTENAKTKTQQDTVIAASKIANGPRGKAGRNGGPAAARGTAGNVHRRWSYLYRNPDTARPGEGRTYGRVR